MSAEPGKRTHILQAPLQFAIPDQIRSQVPLIGLETVAETAWIEHPLLWSETGLLAMDLEPPDSLHAKAAQGWLELGNPVEAQAELEKISPALRAHPEVLMVRWQICAKSKLWEMCLDVADQIIKLAPDLPIGWINKAVAFHGLKRYQQAWETLHPAFEKFPKNKYVMYDLACYECLLGRLEKAKELLEKIFHGEDAMMWKQMALHDPDFEQILDYLQEKQ